MRKLQTCNCGWMGQTAYVLFDICQRLLYLPRAKELCWQETPNLFVSRRNRF